MTPEEYANREAEILKNIPSEFHGPLSYLAYQHGHGSGYHNILIYLEEYAEMIEKPLAEYIKRIT